MRPRLSQDCHARLFRTSFEPRLRRRLSNDGRIFGQNMDARLGSRCMSQRDAYPSRISILDENQDNGMERDINRFKQEKKLTKKSRSASVGRAVGSAKQKEMQEELIIEKARLIEQAALDLEEIKQKKLDVQIGEGGYEPVFKGVLDNTDVATHMFSVFTYVLMAISGLISNTNLTSFIASGNYQLRKDLSLQRGSIFSVHHGGQIAKNLFARKISHIEQREVYGLGVRKLSKLNRACVHYRSEEYDIDETKVVPVVSDEGTGEALVSPWWRRLPKRWLIVLLCFTAFLLCNMDRVNMSIAILPMSQEFNWNSTTVGLIQSSFFWGYLLTQILGGIWADKLGGKVVLGFGVVWWSMATVLTPIAARLGLPYLLIMRAFMGIGEGVAMPAMNNILSKWIPVSERSRSLSLVYSGMYLGSVVGLAFSPFLIQNLGWPSVFYSFGSLGSIWFAFWLQKAYSLPKDDPDLGAEEKRLILEGGVSKAPVSDIPWKLILSKAPVWALIISHFCHNWGTFILLTWMPTYYNQVLKFNLTESGLLCVLPWLTMAVFANIGGWIADTLVSKGVSITAVRKIMQSIGFLGPAFFLTQLSHVKTPAMAVLCMACSQGSDAFSQSGLYSNHQDIGPRYAGVLLGLSNTAGVLAGVFGTAATGYILQKGSWNDVFKVSVALYIIGTLVWNIFSTGEKILD